jgi:hypothetical protein
MAAGDIKWFAQALHDLGEKIHDMSSDTFKLGIITSAVTPALSTAAPHWGGTGTTNFATNQVATGGTSYTGPLTLASIAWTLVSNVPTFRATDPSLAQDASGFTNGRWGIIYNDTDVNKRAVAFIDFGSDRSLVTGSLTINFGGAGTDILTITQS